MGHQQVTWSVLFLVLGLACRKEPVAPPLVWHDPAAGERLARAEGKRVVLFFGADWSKADLDLEQKTFPDPSVRRELADFVLIKVDVTEFDEPVARGMMKRFDVKGDPTTILLRAMDGPELARFTAYVPPAEMAEALAMARR